MPRPITRTINQKIASLAQYFSDLDDDLPLIDIIVSKAKNPSHFRSSVVAFLQEGSFHAHAESPAPDQAISKSLDELHKTLEAYHLDQKKVKPLAQLNTNPVGGVCITQL